jgi:hypothetical protein
MLIVDSFNIEPPPQMDPRDPKKVLLLTHHEVEQDDPDLFGSIWYYFGEKEEIKKGRKCKEGVRSLQPRKLPRMGKKRGTLSMIPLPLSKITKKIPSGNILEILLTYHI